MSWFSCCTSKKQLDGISSNNNKHNSNSNSNLHSTASSGLMSRPDLHINSQHASDALRPFASCVLQSPQHAVDMLATLAETPFAREIETLLQLGSDTTPLKDVVRPMELIEISKVLKVKDGTTALNIARCVAQCVDMMGKAVMDIAIFPKIHTMESNATLSFDGVRKAVTEWLKSNKMLESSVQSAFSTGLLTLYWFSGGRRSLAYDPSIFVLPYVSQIVHALDYTVCKPSRGLESAESVEHTLQDFATVCCRLGILPRQASHAESYSDWVKYMPVWCLDAHAHGILLRMATMTRQTKAVLRPLSKANILDDIVNHGRQLNLLGQAQQYFRVFPYFKSSGGQGNEVEAGEGHGPRKEFFDVAAQASYSTYTHEIDPKGCAHATLTADSDVVVITCVPSTTFTLSLAVNDVIVFKLPHHCFQCNIVRIEPKSTSPGSSTTIKLSAVSTVSSKNVIFTYRHPTVPPFNIDPGATHAWFNPSFEMQPPHFRSLKYTLIGWFIPNAIANGVLFPLPLPDVFFKILKLWPNYHPTEEDLMLLDPSHRNTVAQVRRMSPEDLRELLLMEDLDLRFTSEDYITHLINRYLKESIEGPMTEIRKALEATGLTSTFVWLVTSPSDLRTVVCGRTDDGECDFVLEEEYRLNYDESFNLHSFGVAMKAVFNEVVNGFTAAEKRKFLQFVTGRIRLPPVKQSEIISIELPYSPMNYAEHTAMLHHLPQAHTCTNTIELPNYVEGLLAISSPRLKERNFMSEDDKEMLWDQLTDAQKQNICERAKSILATKLHLCLFDSDGYDLDEMNTMTPRNDRPLSGGRPTSAGRPLSAGQPILPRPPTLPPPVSDPVPQRPAYTTNSSEFDGDGDEDDEDMEAPMEDSAMTAMNPAHSAIVFTQQQQQHHPHVDKSPPPPPPPNRQVYNYHQSHPASSNNNNNDDDDDDDDDDDAELEEPEEQQAASNKPVTLGEDLDALLKEFQVK